MQYILVMHTIYSHFQSYAFIPCQACIGELTHVIMSQCAKCLLTSFMQMLLAIICKRTALNHHQLQLPVNCSQYSYTCMQLMENNSLVNNIEGSQTNFS